MVRYAIIGFSLEVGGCGWEANLSASDLNRDSSQFRISS